MPVTEFSQLVAQPCRHLRYHKLLDAPRTDTTTASLYCSAASIVVLVSAYCCLSLQCFVGLPNVL